DGSSEGRDSSLPRPALIKQSDGSFNDAIVMLIAAPRYSRRVLTSALSKGGCLALKEATHTFRSASVFTLSCSHGGIIECTRAVRNRIKGQTEREVGGAVQTGQKYSALQHLVLSPGQHLVLSPGQHLVLSPGQHL
ncbi:hypothetical protein KUCAC02_032354, partial [Chaenocephalus aceratus]